MPNKHTDHATSSVAIGCIQLLLGCGDKLHDVSAQTHTPGVSPCLHCLKLHFNILVRPIYGSSGLELQHFVKILMTFLPKDVTGKRCNSMRVI